MSQQYGATETEECFTFIAWTKLVRFNGEPLFERLVKIPNERGKPGTQTAILVALGMRAGFPDYDIHAPAGHYHGLYLEEKRFEGGRTKADQVVWRDKLRAWGYHAEICEGALAMIKETKDYFRCAQRHVDQTQGLPFSFIDATEVS